jgi:hypothetical protein
MELTLFLTVYPLVSEWPSLILKDGSLNGVSGMKSQLNVVIVVTDGELVV